MVQHHGYPRKCFDKLSERSTGFDSQGAFSLRRGGRVPAVTPGRIVRWTLAGFLVLGIGLAAAARLSAADRKTAQEKLAQTDWADMHGVNFVPNYARNTYEIWRNYDRDAFERELGMAAGVGFNSVRLWLNYAAFEELGPKMVDRVEEAVQLCAKYHLQVVVNLFDSCGVRPRKDAKMMSRLEAYNLFQSSSRFTPPQKLLMERLLGNFVHGIGGPGMIPVGSDSPMMILIWGDWQPTPGNDRLGAEWYPKLEAYVDAVVGRLKDNPNVVLWDLMNEPEFASEGPLSPTEFITPEMKKTCDAFLQHFHGYIKKRYPNQLVCEGWANVENANKYADLADVLTFHVYAGPEKMQATIDQARAFSERLGKKVVITETLSNWEFGSPEFGKEAPGKTQLAHYQKVLPVLMKSGMGWMSFGLVSKQKDPDSNLDLAILSSDGSPRPAGVYLEKTLKGTQPSRR